MEPLRIAVRVVFVYFFALALVRVSGKREIRHADMASFTLAVILGDLFDDAIWADVPMAEFVVASGMLVVMHIVVSIDDYYRGTRTWRRASTRAGEAR